MTDSVRVRIAPSPTGKFHLGTARTALFNFLLARKFGGKFILRFEDTDHSRSEDIYVQDIINGLRWLGLVWDEGPEVEGPFGPYFQKDRLTIYQTYIDQLLEEKKAYRCFCSPEELEAEKQSQIERGQAPKYSGRCRNLTQTEIDTKLKANTPFIVRFKIEPQTVTVNDLIKGEVKFDSDLIGDFVIVRSSGVPLFVLTNVIDDRLMEISHVLRGEEHLANAAKQILLGDALNFLSPEFGHFPLIFNPDRTKMSKRKDPVSVTEDYQAKGYLPEALVNYLALLGWNSGTDREIYSLDELIAEFTLDRVGKSPAIFDGEKLLWMNGYYIRNAPVGTIATLAKDFIADKKTTTAIADDSIFYLKIIGTIQDRLKTLDEVPSQLEYFYHPPKYQPALLIAKKATKTETRQALELAAATIDELTNLARDEIEVALRSAAKQHNLKDGVLLWAVRAALSGQVASPGAFELVEILGKTESLSRIRTAIKKLA